MAGGTQVTDIKQYSDDELDRQESTSTRFIMFALAGFVALGFAINWVVGLVVGLSVIFLTGGYSLSAVQRERKRRKHLEQVAKLTKDLLAKGNGK